MINNFKLCIIVLAVLSTVFLTCDKSPTNDDTGDTAEWQTVFFDDFNRSDGPAGSNYSAHIYIPSEGFSDTLSISNNMLKLSGEIYYAIRYVNEVTNDVVRVSLKCSTTNAPSGSYAFGVSARTRDVMQQSYQESYSGFVSMDEDSIAILKLSGSELPPPLISKAYDVQENRSYLLELTVNKNDLTFIVKDFVTGIAETLNVKDTGSLLTGGIVCINGMQSEGDVIYFDDFKIEKYE